MDNAKSRDVFVTGPVSCGFIGESIAELGKRKDIGAHSIFLGQVRNDELNERRVTAIEYSAYHEMAEAEFDKIREEAFAKYALTCLHIHHSLGRVEAGEICLFILASSRHRKDATDACNFIVNRLKSDVPVWGKEVCEEESYAWKKNE